MGRVDGAAHHLDRLLLRRDDIYLLLLCLHRYAEFKQSEGAKV